MNLNRDWDVIVAGIMTLALAFFVGVPIAGDLAHGETLMERVYEVEPTIDRNAVLDQITDSLLASASWRNEAIFIAAVVVFIVVWSRPVVSWLRQDFSAEIYLPLRTWLTRDERSKDAARADAPETPERPSQEFASDAAKSERTMAQPEPAPGEPFVRPSLAEALSRATRSTVLCDVAFALAATATLFCFVLIGLPDRNGLAAVLASDVAEEYPTVEEASLQNQFAELVHDHDAHVERMFAGLLGLLCALFWMRPFFVLFRGATTGSAYPTV